MPFARRPLALLLCCGFAGAVLGSLPEEALAQGMTPLSVDPTLLGLPPAQPKPKPASRPAEAESAPRATATPVTAPEPIPSKELHNDGPAPAAAKPAPATKAVATPAPQPAPAPAAPARKVAAPAAPIVAAPPVTQPAPVVPVTTQAAEASRPATVAPAAVTYPTPARPAPQAAQASGGLAPLRVDPALLGLPPAPATTQVARPAAPAATPITSTGAAPAATPATTTAATATSPAGATTTSAVAPGRRAVRAPLVAPAEVLAREPAATPAPARTVAAAAAPAPIAHKGEAAGGTALGPLKVDPTLLGLAPLPAPAAPPQIVNAVSDPQAEAEAMAPALPPRRRRGEETENAAPLPYAERDPGPALALRRSRNMTPLPKNDDARPTFLTARRLYGVADREAVLEGDAEMRRSDTVLTSDRLVYWQNEDEVEATGNVVYEQEGTKVSGPSLLMRLSDSTGVFDQAAYSIRQERKVPVWGVRENSQAMGTTLTTGRGQSEKMEFLGENHIRLANATYTTCAPGNNDWYAKADSLDLNYDSEEGEGKNGTLYFKDVPIFYMPSMSFALNNRRKSGFLAPTFGTNSLSGATLTTPYYWNIAPNMDATIAPRVMTKRGLQLGGELRYLNYDYSGYARGEYVPTDNVRNLDNRYAVNIWHNHNFGNGFTGLLNLNKVSDDYFYTDLSSRIGVSAQTLLPRQGILTYGSTWWSASANINRYQTLQPDIDNRIEAPYDLIPQISINARRPDYFGTDVAFMGQFSSFSHRTKVEGDRTIVYPQVSLPLTFPAFYVTPKIGMHVTSYSLSHQAATVPDRISRSLPIFSVDSGLTFERDTTLLGTAFTQTLEPRLYYVYVPNKDQSNIPIFDTGIADFNFGQIFSENRYVGQDRIGDANQLTAAVTTRFIGPNTGREYFRALVGQRYYFDDQMVTVPGEKPRQHKNTNWLAAASGQIMPKTYLDGAVEYNPFDARTDRLTVAGRYQPELGKVLNAGYRYTRDVLGNLDVSGQWPLGRGWYGVGRYNYSLKEKRVVENIAGLEYNGGCWVVRGVIQRYALTANTSSTAFFVQLELNDFSRIGSNPLTLLRRTIPGYGRINQPMADPVFGGEE